MTAMKQKKHLTLKKKYDTISLPNKLNIHKAGIFLYPFLDAIIVEFDKIQIPYNGSIYYSFLYMVCLATTGICGFMR